MNQLDKIEALIASGQTEEGLAMLKKLSASEDADHLFGAAQIYQQYGFLDEAEKLYEHLLGQYPDDSGVLLNYAELLIDKSEEDRAIHCLEKIGPSDPGYLAAQLQLADVYQLEGLFEVAEAKLLGALKQAHDEPVLLAALGEFYLSVGDAREAIPYLEKVRKCPELADRNIELKLAEALSLCGEFEQSVNAYRRGLKKKKTLDGLFGYAMTLTRIGRYQKAIQVLEELKKMDPGYSTLYPLLAKAYEHEKMTDEALRTVEEGLSEDEFNERLLEEAGHLAVKLHDTEKAMHYYQTIVARDPEHREAMTKLVELKAAGEDYDGIIDLLETETPDDPLLTWFLATAYYRTEKWDKAGACYAACRAAFKNNPEFLQEYGEYLRERGKLQESLQMLKRAAALDPGNQDLVLFVERLEQDDRD